MSEKAKRYAFLTAGFAVILSSSKRRRRWRTANRPRPNSDTGGEFGVTLGSPPQGLEVGASRFCSWSAGPPRVHPDQIDCDGGGDVLQACLREPDIAASPQSAAADRLFMCSLNACACGVALFEIFRRLMLSGGLQRLMMLTRLQSNDAGLSLGFGALGPQRARRTILGGKSCLEHSAVLRIGVWYVNRRGVQTPIGTVSA
jgi:hypothetical protein